MRFTPRAWQIECLARFKEVVGSGKTSFVLEACMGAGKSAMAAWIAQTLIKEYGIDHILVLVPWQAIQGDIDKGMLGAFGEMGLDARDQFFSYKRRQARQPRPEMDATIVLYQGICSQDTLDTISMWQADPRGFRFALICDEIHHTNEINSKWGAFVEQLEDLAAYSIFMSGTFFRSDRIPISCIPPDAEGNPSKDYSYPYSRGVQDNVVRAVTTRNINAKVIFYDGGEDRQYEVDLSGISKRELAEAKKQVLDPNGECVKSMIQTVDQALMQTRSKFADAGCLFVCRPGGSDNFTEDGGEFQEDKHVRIIARRIQEITGYVPTVVTYDDQDSLAKIARFRRGTDPYLVAVNMVSEGCDIPRLRAVAFCRYTNSEMLFRQIVGRALRMHVMEDGTAAQIYIPAFPLLIEFAERLYKEAQEGIVNRPRCSQCGQWPCICPCPVCKLRPCICPCLICGQRPCVCGWDGEPELVGIDAVPVLDGGHVGAEHVTELYVGFAQKITQEYTAHRHSNHTQLGLALQEFEKMRRSPQTAGEIILNPGVERERLREKINRWVKRLAYAQYDKDYQAAYHREIEIPFGASFKVIVNTWTVEQLRRVADRLEDRIMEVYRGA
jgi:superfamily II DNA or RNA helicase